MSGASRPRPSSPYGDRRREPADGCPARKRKAGQSAAQVAAQVAAVETVRRAPATRRDACHAATSYHPLSARHLPAHLDEMEWRFNNRDNNYLFRDILIRLLTAEALPFAELVG